MFKAIANTFANCFKIPELKSRIFFTLLILGICRLISVIPIPGVDGHALQKYFDDHAAQGGNSLLGMYSLFTGGAMEHCAVGSLGIMPYISATIIIQLLTAVIPTLSKLAREEGGRPKIVQYGRYLTVALCLGQGVMMAFGWEHPDKILPGFLGKLVMMDNLWWYRFQTMLVLTTATMLLMWLGEQITERGIGNGISLVITIGILARLPHAGRALFTMFVPLDGVPSRYNFFHGIALVLLLLAVIAGVIAVTQAQRKIPVQYAQHMVGRKVYGGGSSFLPLRVNYAGVMPVIFAQAFLMIPQWLFDAAGKILSDKYKFIKDTIQSMSGHMQQDAVVYLLFYSLMILFFSYFWVATQFNELQIADDLKKHNGYVPGVRPGVATSDFLHKTMSRITLAGAIFLTVIAVIPIILYRIMTVPHEVAQFFGGTSLLITVGVLLDTVRQMESHLLMRHYDGFLKKGKIKGRF